MNIPLMLVTLIGSLFAICEVNSQACTDANCLLPDCRCVDEILNRDYPINDTPQLVMITFNDALTAQIYDLVMPIIDGRTNPDGCPASITFFHSHEYTDYAKVHHLWANGHELGLHSISNSPYAQYWSQISLENITAEFGDQRKIVSYFGQVDESDIQGIRVPHLALSGDTSFQAIRDLGLVYDSSWPTQTFFRGLWPYTLDFPSVQDCALGRCPTSSIPGVWVIPMLMWNDLDGNKCSLVDACQIIPDDIDGIVNWMKSNFHRVYDSTRVPFPIYMNGAWLLKHENHITAFRRFLDYIQSVPDTYFVSSKRVIEYVRNPRQIPVSGMIFDSCQATHTNTCVQPRSCQLLREDVHQERWMTSCVPCPAVFPWIDNPYGLVSS